MLTSLGEVWDAQTGAVLHSLQVLMAAAVEVFPSGDRLLTMSSGGEFSVWDATTGRKRCELVGQSTSMNAFQIFPAGDRVITSRDNTMAIIWNASDCEELHTLEHESRVRGVAVVRGGLQVATLGQGGSPIVWSAATGERLRVLADNVGTPLNGNLEAACMPGIWRGRCGRPARITRRRRFGVGVSTRCSLSGAGHVGSAWRSVEAGSCATDRRLCCGAAKSGTERQAS